MEDEGKPSFQDRTPPSSPRSRLPVSDQAPLAGAVSYHRHNTSLPQLFYSPENGYQNVHHLRSSSDSLSTISSFHDAPSRPQTPSVRSTESQEDKRQQRQRPQLTPNHQHDEFITYYQLIPVYDSIGGHATTVVLIPVTKQIRRPLDGTPGSAEYTFAAPQPSLERRPRPMSMPLRKDNSWTTGRSVFDTERSVGSSPLHQYASLSHVPEPTIHDYHKMNSSTPKDKRSLMRHLKDKMRKIFGKKPGRA